MGTLFFFFFAIRKTLTFLLYLKGSPLHAVQDSVGNWFKIQIPTSDVTVSYTYDWIWPENQACDQISEKLFLGP